MLKVAVIAPHLGHAAAAMKFFGFLVGGQVQTQTMGIKHQGRKLAAGQSAAKWCCRYRESKTSWISWAPRYTLKPGQSQRHWDSAAKSRTSVIKRKALSLSGFQRLNNRDAWGMQTSFFGCKFVSFPLGMTSEIFRALVWRKFSKKNPTKPKPPPKRKSSLWMDYMNWREINSKQNAAWGGGDGKTTFWSANVERAWFNAVRRFLPLFSLQSKIICSSRNLTKHFHFSETAFDDSNSLKFLD